MDYISYEKVLARVRKNKDIKFKEVAYNDFNHKFTFNLNSKIVTLHFTLDFDSYIISCNLRIERKVENQWEIMFVRNFVIDTEDDLFKILKDYISED